MYNDSVIQEQSGLNAFYNKIYSLVGIGVGISALVSGLMMTVFQDFFVQILTTAPMVYYGAVVVELILVFVASGKAVKNSPSALPIFLIYSALNGFTLSFIIARYMQATVYKAFLVSALMFIVMGAIGRVVKKDLADKEVDKVKIKFQSHRYCPACSRLTICLIIDIANLLIIPSCQSCKEEDR